jgi:hypothetical protein
MPCPQGHRIHPAATETGRHSHQERPRDGAAALSRLRQVLTGYGQRGPRPSGICWRVGVFWSFAVGNRLAAWAHAGGHRVHLDVDESVLGGGHLRPPRHLQRAHVHYLLACSADEGAMVGAAGAQAVAGLTSAARHHRDVALAEHGLQVPVHRDQSDPVLTGPKVVIQLGYRPKRAVLGQHGDQCVPVRRMASPRSGSPGRQDLCPASG